MVLRRAASSLLRLCMEAALLALAVFATSLVTELTSGFMVMVFFLASVVAMSALFSGYCNKQRDWPKLRHALLRESGGETFKLFYGVIAAIGMLVSIYGEPLVLVVSLLAFAWGTNAISVRNAAAIDRRRESARLCNVLIAG